MICYNYATKRKPPFIKRKYDKRRPWGGGDKAVREAGACSMRAATPRPPFNRLRNDRRENMTLVDWGHQVGRKIVFFRPIKTIYTVTE